MAMPQVAGSYSSSVNEKYTKLKAHKEAAGEAPRSSHNPQYPMSQAPVIGKY
jgi:hypothetical protein